MNFKTFLSTILLCFYAFSLTAQTSLQGKVTDTDTGEPIIFGTVALFQNSVLIIGGETDFDGNYSINPLAPSTYDVEFTYIGLTTTRIEEVLVATGKSNMLDAEMRGGDYSFGCPVMIHYTIPLIKKDNTTQGKTMSDKDIQRAPVRNINELIIGF